MPAGRPFTSEQQRRFFRLCKVAPGRARQKCPPAKVVNELIAEDKGGRLRRVAPRG